MAKIAVHLLMACGCAGSCIQYDDLHLSHPKGHSLGNLYTFYKPAAPYIAYGKATTPVLSVSLRIGPLPAPS